MRLVFIKKIMARKHVEFIQSADVIQKPWLVDGFLDGALTRILSFDSQNGASTELVEWTQNWESSSGYFNCDVELLVLTGELQIGKFTLGRYTYGFIPKGVCIEALSIQENTIILWMPAARASFVKSSCSAAEAKSQDYIPSLNTYHISWSQTLTPGFPQGAMRKTLRIDTEAKRSSWLIGLLPQFKLPYTEYHPLCEEAFVLQGSLSTRAGYMTPGCYFWRPELIMHGPEFTETGFLAFVRGGYPHLTYHA